MPAVGALGAVGAGVSAISSITGGIAANTSAQREASLQRQQGDVAFQESQVNANNEAFNQTQAVQRQKLAFLANGVTLEGSPTEVLASSKGYGQSSVDAILNQGAAQKNLAYGQAANTADKGRAALLSGVLSGVGTGIKGGVEAYQAGMLDPSKKTTATVKR